MSLMKKIGLGVVAATILYGTGSSYVRIKDTHYAAQRIEQRTEGIQSTIDTVAQATVQNMKDLLSDNPYFVEQVIHREVVVNPYRILTNVAPQHISQYVQQHPEL